jgi:hypothetical protein
VLPITAEHVTVPPTAILFVTSIEGQASLLSLLLLLAADILVQRKKCHSVQEFGKPSQGSRASKVTSIA